MAGQNEAYPIQSLTAFKSAERKNEMMSVVVQLGRRHRKFGSVLFGDRDIGGQDAWSIDLAAHPAAPETESHGPNPHRRRTNSNQLTDLRLALLGRVQAAFGSYRRKINGRRPL